MFDFLKKKISGFIDGFTGKEEAKAESVKEPEMETEPASEREALETKPEPIIEKPETVVISEPAIEKEKPRARAEAKPEPIIEKPKTHEKPEPETKPITEKRKPVHAIETKPKPILEKKKPETRTEAKPEPVVGKEKPEIIEAEPRPAERQRPQPETAAPAKPKIETKPEAQKPEPAVSLPQFREEKERAKKSGVSFSPLKAIRTLVSREVEISEGDVKSLLENFELELLESDVELGVAESIRQELAQKLVGAKVEKANLNRFVKQAIAGTLVDTMSVGEPLDMLEYIREKEKPVKIVFLGINGAGKTTTIAKVANMLMQDKRKVVFAAADTFRAAAIEQMEVHATKLDVRLIKREYGSDPTSVAYDAVNYAKAHGIDAVLIDTAGRQDTNVNLINELKKMDRVIKPDLKIYIGESIAGSSIIGQVSSFNREIGVDGVILTKLDCDPKGGTVLSVSKATGIPIIYIGTGQKYEDIERFDAKKMAERIIS
jgi:fused signal recognition particle receptor